ncbi:MAG: 2-oxo-4-hydroxy-4-carboxy-5-ureidoimidazoline decarboxylase [Planctomycetales bacterium]|nr:2-oxo-4-hydroxy-4-carboxy-5-ureidoimidazoline decarboxylase [Planctomycetales bacterium]
MSTATFLNALSDTDARAALTDCCASTAWVEAMLCWRPFVDDDALDAVAAKCWRRLGEEDWLEAFAAHPMIGDVDSLRAKYASTKATATGEQSGVSGASEATLAELARLNHQYAHRFGFIFIVFATGKGADEMLALLKERLDNPRDAELHNAAEEQLKITQLRLRKLASAPAANSNNPVAVMSPLTTHVLNTHLGQPAAGVAITLELAEPFAAGEWRELAHGVTNHDGRIPDLLPPDSLVKGRYRMTFATGAYFAAQGVDHFYPQVTVEFEIDHPGEHYHVPLLLSPFGYSTYRGS